ncbi:hypothetical protein SRHO_G00325520 [Serrasalmus rhombeus]
MVTPNIRLGAPDGLKVPRCSRQNMRGTERKNVRIPERVHARPAHLAGIAGRSEELSNPREQRCGKRPKHNTNKTTRVPRALSASRPGAVIKTKPENNKRQQNERSPQRVRTQRPCGACKQRRGLEGVSKKGR